MPYKSQAQRRWAHTRAGTKALGGKAAVAHWDAASKGKKLPARKKKKKEALEMGFPIVHGQTGSREWIAWQRIMNRCYNPNHDKFKYYGGRGIVVCDRWHEAKNFLEDMGKKPSPSHTIERIDNSQGYSPENCCWATQRDQNRNKGNIKLTLAKVREIRMLRERGYLLKELAHEFGISTTHVSDIIRHKTWKEDDP